MVRYSFAMGHACLVCHLDHGTNSAGDIFISISNYEAGTDGRRVLRRHHLGLTKKKMKTTDLVLQTCDINLKRMMFQAKLIIPNHYLSLQLSVLIVGNKDTQVASDLNV